MFPPTCCGERSTFEAPDTRRLRVRDPARSYRLPRGPFLSALPVRMPGTSAARGPCPKTLLDREVAHARGRVSGKSEIRFRPTGYAETSPKWVGERKIRNSKSEIRNNGSKTEQSITHRNIKDIFYSVLSNFTPSYPILSNFIQFRLLRLIQFLLSFVPDSLYIVITSPIQSHQVATSCRTTPRLGCKVARGRTSPYWEPSGSSSLLSPWVPWGRSRDQPIRHR